MIAAVVAAGSTSDPTGESVKSGPIGLVVIIVLCIGCYFLFKSMSKHLRRVREEFPAQLPGDAPSAARAAEPRVATKTPDAPTAAAPTPAAPTAAAPTPDGPTADADRTPDAADA